MKSKYILYISILLLIPQNTLHSRTKLKNQPNSYSWAVIGAGVAGITALAMLIDCGIDPAYTLVQDFRINWARR